ncbi:MAG: efflux RND transporter periplasmic adaptor subunit [Verrucomicrobia bacterium]|nr:efflux RND transporter periplasmic adaptor subunit [Verrucomicrobiota bacterium]
MLRKYILPVLAVAGVAFGIYTALDGSKTPPPAPPVSDAAQPPFKTFVAGSGIVEASTENIAIGTHIAGIVSKIYVRTSDNVKAGDPLFTIDDRAQRAEVETHKAAVRVAEAQLADTANQLNIAETLAAQKITSIEDRDRNRYAAQKAEAQLAQARAELVAAETNLERLTVHAPVDGQVLQLKVHPGEYATTGVQPQPLLLLGSVTPLHVRVDVDENEAWRVRASAGAVGYLRGNKTISKPLIFVRFEPYVVPKKSLTGESTERVDTRVLQVVFSFDRGEQPIFIGQQMDVFIDAGESKLNGSASTNGVLQ